jgi:vacuolar protein sorting-associated protein 35
MASRRNCRHSTQRLLHASRSGNQLSFAISLNFQSETLILLSIFKSQDSNNLRDSLKCSALMLSELRTSKLSPHKYYDLCTFLTLISGLNFSNSSKWFELKILFIYLLLDMRAFDELRKLEMFFKDESRHGVSIVDLYELVQHAGNILPRL